MEEKKSFKPGRVIIANIVLLLLLLVFILVVPGVMRLTGNRDGASKTVR